MEGRSTLIPAALGAAALAAAAAAAGAAAYSRTSHSAQKAPISLDQDAYYLVIFLDDPETGCSKNGTLVRVPKSAAFQVLESLVGSALQLICPATLFLYDTKEQLLPGSFHAQLTQHMRDSASWRGSHVIPVIATTSSNAQLSKQAQSLQPVRAPPAPLKMLPVLKNALVVKGPYDPPLYNAWHNLFTPDKVEQWGETVSFLLPHSQQDMASLAHHVDDPSALAFIQTCDPDILGELLERQQDFPKTWNRAVERALTRLGNNGIFTSDTNSTDWQTVHGLFPRGFNQVKITQSYFPIILQKTHNFVAAWSRYPPGHLVTEVNTWLANMTADAVIKASCNIDMDNIARKERGEPAHPVLEVFREIGRISPATSWPWQVVGLANFLNPFYDTKAGQERIFQNLKGKLEDLVEDVVERTRRGEMGSTLLGSLINDPSPTNGLYVRQRLLFGQFVNLLVAGHETTANTMGFLMYYLSQHPEWEMRLRQEIREVLGGRSELTAADIPKLVVAEACFKEALRLHPPAAQVGRDAAHDTVLQGKFLVRRGQRVQVNLVALHRQERQWGGRFGDPNTFNPDRFMPGVAGPLTGHPHAFKPFGFGVRACVGSQFALWEAKTLIPLLYNNFTFKLVENFKLQPSRKESFPSPSAQGLAFYIYPAPGAPAPLTVARSININSSTALPAAAISAASAGGAAGAGGGAAVAAAVATPATPTKQSTTGAGGAAGDTEAHNTPLLVLYGSNSGTCEAFAAQVVDAAAAAGFAASAATLDSHMTAAGVPALPEAGAVLVIASTYNGLPPDNAVRFAKWLSAAGGSSAAAVKGLVFAVLGVGNSQWVTFQAFPKLVDEQLAAAGGERLAPMACADTEESGFLDRVGEWAAAVIPALLNRFQVNLPSGVEAAAVTADLQKKPHLQLAPAPPGIEPLLVKDILLKLKSSAEAAVAAGDAATGAVLQQTFGYDLLKVVSSEQLQQEGSGRFTKHVELELPDSMTYTPGDHLEVLPRNAPHLVDFALQLLSLTGTEVFEWTPATQAAARGFNPQAWSQRPAAETWASSIGPLPLTSSDVLAWLVDLSAVPSKRILESLAEACPCPPEAAKLREMAAEELYKQQVSGPRLTLLELLSSFRSLLAVVDLVSLANMLPRLAPRYYSISSSPAAAGAHRATITVALVEFTTPLGRHHLGAASSTIHNQQTGLYLAGTVRQLQSSFKLPADPTTPLIMIGPGTGVAPMIGFLEEREARSKAGAALGPALMFFGCRSANQDFLYKSRLLAWKESGVLTDLQVAFSRQPGQPKTYVQHLIAADGKRLWHLLASKHNGARVYVCGDAKYMAPDVRAAFVEVAKAVGGLGQQAAEQWLQELREGGRYLEDVWAS